MVIPCYTKIIPRGVWSRVSRLSTGAFSKHDITWLWMDLGSTHDHPIPSFQTHGMVTISGHKFWSHFLAAKCCKKIKNTKIPTTNIQPSPATPHLAAPRVVVDTARKQMQMVAQQHSTTTIIRVLGTASPWLGQCPLETGKLTNEGKVGMFKWEQLNRDLKFEATKMVVQASSYCGVAVATWIFLRRGWCIVPVPLACGSFAPVGPVGRDDPAIPPRHMKTPSLASGYATCGIGRECGRKYPK